MTPAAARYLRALGCAPAPPTPAFLRGLIAAQQRAFPYESVSKLLFAGRGLERTATLEEYLDGQEEFGFGGTCIAQNAHFTALLTALGFDATLVGVHTNGQEDHASILIALGGESWHVDLGLMSTFTGPLPLRGEPLERAEGYRLLRFIPAGDGANYRREIIRDGEVKRRIESQAGPRTLASFAATVAKSFAPEAIFMKTLAVYQVAGGRELSIWNREYHATAAGATVSRTLAGAAELRAVLAAEFKLPRYPVDEAVRVLRERNGFDLFTCKTP